MSTLDAYLGECRTLVAEELRRLVPRDDPHASVLYDHMLDYPTRASKGLRPALCIATCRALGGHLEACLPTAAVLELYHNAFLIHDDIEDGSSHRRGAPTFHRLHGVPIAINVGDAMLALALQPLLDNMRLIGMGPSLHILQEVASMARVSTEGQAIELDWIRRGCWDIDDADYVDMVRKKTARYTFVTPMKLGALIAGHEDVDPAVLDRFATQLGVAFQIHDDVLNIVGDEQLYGKERDGDLWEGKHTLLLLHALRSASASQRERAEQILAKPRARTEAGLAPKTEAEVAFLRGLIDESDAVARTKQLAASFVDQAAQALEQLSAWLRPSAHTDVLFALVDYVVERVR